MLKTLKFPLIYIIELVLWLPFLAGFAITASFLASKPISDLDLQGKSLPATWEAAIANHGKFLEGYLIANHPVAFSVGVALLLLSTAVLYPVHKAQMSQHQAAEPSQKIAHTIAHVVVGAVLLGIGYLFMTRYLVGVAPA